MNPPNETSDNPQEKPDLDSQGQALSASEEKPSKSKKKLPILGIMVVFIILVITILAFGALYYANSDKSKINFCTQEAKLCPDGVTYVSRQGPKCEFAECPEAENINASETFNDDEYLDSESDYKYVEEETVIFPTPEIDPESGWKIFKMPEYSISVPAEFNINSDSSTKRYLSITNYDVATAPGRSFSPSLDAGNLKIEIVKDDTNRNLDEYMNTKYGNAYKKIKINNDLSGYEVFGREGPGTGYPTYFVENPTSEEIYYLHFWLDFNNYSDLRSQILSTFQFTK
jgi:cytoskeletal protein RodZ